MVDHIRRLEEITRTLAKYGFVELIELLRGSSNATVRHFVSEFFPRTPKEPLGVRLRMVLEELGPTFIKFGQLLSSRADMLPRDVLEEMEKLQDDVPPFAYEEVQEILDRELGGASKVFASIDKKPLAAASIGQVHRARLKTGESVIIKVQRPGIEELVEADLVVLANLASWFESHFPETRFYQPAEFVRQFGQTLRRELDFLHEARSAERFRKNFQGDKTIYVPKVYPEFTTKHVLVMEYIEGVKLTRCASFPLSRRKKIVERGSRAVLKEVLVFGFFQGDPHPGNLLVMKNDVIGVVDFGMTGFIDAPTREKTADFFAALIQKDTQKLVDYFLSAGVISPDSNVEEFKSDLTEVIEQYYDFPIQEMRLDEIVRDLAALIRTYKVRMHPKAMLLLRLLVTLEGVGRRLYPEFNTVTAAKPLVEELLRERARPHYILKKSLGRFSTVSDALAKIPAQFSSVLGKAESGNLDVNIEHHGLEQPVFQLDKTINKVALALIVAALIMASSILMAVQIKPLIYGYSLLGLAGMVVALLLGFTLVASIFASREF